MWLLPEKETRGDVQTAVTNAAIGEA